MQGIVIYVDGGCINNPGPAGYGFHGYLYDTETTKKIPGNIGHILTSEGYVLKLGMDEGLVYNEVIPSHYVDGYGSIPAPATNNAAEVTAVIRALEYSNAYDITTIQLFSDSEYTCTGVDHRVDNWVKNGWKTVSGMEPANGELWKTFLELRDRIVARGVTINIGWVKGHSDILGNVLADKLATVATEASVRNKIVSDTLTSSPIGYWKTEMGEHHPFISNSRMFFNTLPDYNKPGEYYLGETSNDDDTFGQKTSDGTYSVVKLENPDLVLEMVRNYQMSVSYGKDSIIMARLDAIYRGAYYNDITIFGDLAIKQTSKNRLDLSVISKDSDGYNYKEPLTREFIPPKLCMRAVENISRIAIILEEYVAKHPDLIITDITDIIYITEDKADKKGVVTSITKLRPECGVGIAAINTKMNYKTDDGIASTPIILTIGIDLINRNSLKKLESLNPKIVIVTWLDAPDVVRYATIIESGKDIAIYCGTYSNRKILSPIK